MAVNLSDDNNILHNHYLVTHLWIFADRKMNITLLDDATAAKLVQDASDTLFHIFLQGRSDINVVASDDQGSVGNFGTHGQIGE